jgi:hypothetical protein
MAQLSGMLGVGADSEEAMMGKLEQTKKVIEEVNKQFKNPVRSPLGRSERIVVFMYVAGHDDVRVRVHTRVLVPVRDGTAGAGAQQVPNRRAEHHHQPGPLPRAGYRLLLR